MQPLKRAVAHPSSRILPLFELKSRRKPFICNECRRSSQLPIAQPPPTRPFSSTTLHHKKSSSNSKSARKTPQIDPPEVNTHIPDNKATRNKDAEIDPYDYTTLQSGIDRAITRLKDSLTKHRDSGGRVSPAQLESLPVELNLKDASSSTAHKEQARLGDIASVVPKGGRTLQIFAAEESHIKPLLSALRASEYSLAPEQAKPTDPNPLCITIPIPPVTAETRAAAAAEAKKSLEKANGEIRNARGDAQKKFRRMEMEKLVIVDELRKAHKGMEEVVRRGNEEAKKVFEGAVKALER